MISIGWAIYYFVSVFTTVFWPFPFVTQAAIYAHQQGHYVAGWSFYEVPNDQ